MGVRPTETVSAMEKINKGGDHGEKQEETLPEANEEDEIVDLTSGKAMCFAETLEMELESNVEPAYQSKQSTGEQQCEQEPSQPSSETQNNQNGTISEPAPPTPGDEASALFAGPPPGNVIYSTPVKEGTSETIATRGHSPLPPPPFAPAYTSPYPQQATATPDVDLR